MPDNKSVYIKYPDNKTRAFATSNIGLPSAITSQYTLSTLELVILLEIIGEYDGNKQTPCKLSYRDFEDRTNRSVSAVKRAIKALLAKELIIQCLNRKGKAKSEYIPNVDILHSLVFDYWDFVYGEDAPHKQERDEMNEIKEVHKNP